MRLTLTLLLVLQPSAADAEERSAERLQRAVILMRHGVRSAMSTPEQLHRYSVKPWPAFSVPPGHLTPKGAALAQILGRYYRESYLSHRLMKKGDCEAAYFWANRTQRTEATARAFASGLLPECDATVHTVDEGVDPLFDAPAAGIGQLDLEKVQAAILGRMGGDPQAWSKAQRSRVAVLDALLLQCKSVPCPSDVGKGKQRLADTPSVVGVGTREKIVNFTASAAAASGITESLLMSYAEGHLFDGWDGITEDVLFEVFALHTAQFELRARTQYVAQATSSHLAMRLLATLHAGASMPYRGEPIGGRQPIIVIVGHDGTLVQLGGLLGIDWLVSGYPQNQAVPGGALVFEIWRRADGEEVLRLRYVAQSLRQLREASALGAEVPPLSAPIFIPGCSEAGTGFDCPLERFTARVEGLVDASSSSSIAPRMSR